MGHGKRVCFFILHTSLLQLFFVPAHACGGEVEHLYHACAQHRPAVALPAAEQVCGDTPALSVCRSGKRYERFSAVRADNADSVARGKNVLIACTHEFVRLYSAVCGKLQPRLFCKGGFGSHSQSENHRARVHGGAVRKRDLQSAVRAFNRLYASIHAHVHAAAFKRVGYKQSRLLIERRHKLGRKLRQSHLNSAANKVFRYLHAYKTAARDQRVCHLVIRKISVQIQRVAHVAQGEHPLSAKAESLCSRARGKHKFIVTFLIFALRRAHGYRMRLAVNSDDFGHNAHVYVESCAQKRGRSHGKVLFPLYFPAYIIRQSAVCVRYVFSALENDYLRPLVQSAQTGGATRASGNSAYNYYFHIYLPLRRIFYNNIIYP